MYVLKIYDKDSIEVNEQKDEKFRLILKNRSKKNLSKISSTVFARFVINNRRKPFVPSKKRILDPGRATNRRRREDEKFRLNFHSAVGKIVPPRN